MRKGIFRNLVGNFTGCFPILARFSDQRQIDDSNLIDMGELEKAYWWFLHHFDSSYTKRILIESVDLLGKLWPYLVSGIIVSTLIYLYLSKQFVARFFSRRGKHISIILASLIGVLSPVGSYVLIPLSAALTAIGVPLPVLMALMVSSPLINPNLFMLTAGSMGLEMAIMRVVSAFSLGIVSGYLTQWALIRGWLKPEQILNNAASITMSRFPVEEPVRSMGRFFIELWKMTKWISRYFFLAILLAAALKILIHPDYFIRILGDNQFLVILATTAAGVPFYVCGGAAIPVVQQLMDLGLPQGAVLAFFISGPVTRISNLIVLRAAFNWKILALYLIIGIGGAILFGMAYGLWA